MENWADYKKEKPTETGLYVVRIRQLSMSGFTEILPKVVFSKNIGRFMGVGTDDIKVTHWFKLPDLKQ